MNKSNKGFTLLEILLVIAAIGILAAIVIVAINPLRQIGKVRQAERASEINQLNKAIEQYFIDEGKYPDSLTGIGAGEYREVCNTDDLPYNLTEQEVIDSGVDCTDDGDGNPLVDLRVLVPKYVAGIPKDSGLSFGYRENIFYKTAEAAVIDRTGYLVGITPENKLSVIAKGSSLGTLVSINPMPIALTISGTASEGETLTATLEPTGFGLTEGEIIWYRIEGGEEVEVGRGTTYTVQIEDEGLVIIAKLVLGESSLATGNGVTIGGGGGGGAPETEWSPVFAKSLGSTNNDEPSDLVVDSLGNSYVIGSYSGNPFTFGDDINSNTINISPIGIISSFIAKYNPVGELLWVKNIGGTNGEDNIRSISLDSGNNIYITGGFGSSTLPLGNDINSTPITLTNSGSASDIFIIKYNSNGDLLWGKSSGSSGRYDMGNGIVTDSSNNIYVTGQYASTTLTLGEGGNQVVLTNASSNGRNDIFTAKYDTDGNLLWAKTAGGTGFTDNGDKLSLDDNGNIYVIGVYDSAILSFGNDINSNPVNLSHSGNGDTFIVKYNSTGDLIWAIKIGTIGVDEINDIKVDSIGNFYIVRHGFLARYDTNGNLIWENSQTGTGEQQNLSVDIDSSNNIYISGTFTGSDVTIGNDINSNPVIINSSVGYINSYIVKYNDSGQVLNHRYIESNNGVVTKYLSLRQNGDVYVSGRFISEELSFGNDINGNPLSVFNQGGNPEGYPDEIFLMRLINSYNLYL